jgi:hypothetical protein
MTAPAAGTPIDQRTGQPIVIGAIPSAAQQAEDRRAQSEDAQRLRADAVALLEQHFAPVGTVIDQRRLNALVQAELDRLTALPDGIARAIAQLREAARAAAKAAKAREKEFIKERESDTIDAKKLLAEVESRSAWVHDNLLASRANEARLQELIDELTAIESQHHLGIALGRYVRLPGDCAAAAGQKLQIHGLKAAAGHLPELEQCPQLPEEFGRPQRVASNPSVDQRGKPFDPTLPKDYAIRMAAASTPAPRNVDGTLAGVYLPDPHGGIRHAPVPRSEAQERAVLKKVAGDIAAEDGANGKP